MAADHESCNSKSEAGILTRSSFIFSISVVSLLAGFGLTLGRVRRKNPTEFGEVAATKLAAKALGYGTLLSVTGCGLLVVAIKSAFGIKNVKEFSEIMREKLPQKDGEFVSRFESLKLPRNSSEKDELEWEEAISK